MANNAIWGVCYLPQAKGQIFQVRYFYLPNKEVGKNGAIYERLTKVHKWKKFLPDGASIGKTGFRKKHMTSFSREYLERYLLESCRAELTHWLAILPFWVFGLFAPPRVVAYMFIYALVVNIPCIIAQRYNRPRMVRMLKKINRKTEKTE